MKDTLILTFFCLLLICGCSEKITSPPDTDVPTTPTSPPAVEKAATGTPLFIGYTERATMEGSSVTNKIVKMSSLQEFTTAFGGAAPQGSPQPHYLHPSVVEFYAHGGKTCYVRSVGGYSSPIQRDALMEAVGTIERRAPESDMILIPDALALAAEDCYDVYRYVLNHCSQVKSCVGIFDIHGGGQAGANQTAAIANFRSNIGEDHLRFGIAYYPWAKTETGSLPVAGIMAGIIAETDRTRGIWTTPANKPLRSGLLPTITISSEEQQDLNVDAVGGKSINAIRTFTGQGTLVWGGRTLAGNSLDWRYISTVRTSLMIENELALQLKAYVFEPNTANTWATIRSEAENYLTDLWRSGALQGVTPDQAFSVRIGLGQTMTSSDILEGMLLLEVNVALNRPAEFFTFSLPQQMQKSK